LYTDHVLAWLRSLPPSYPIGMTAGGLLRRFENLPDAQACVPLTPVTGDRCRLGRGQALRRMIDFMRTCDSSQSVLDISLGAKVNLGTVGNYLKPPHFERDPEHPRRWRLCRPACSEAAS
jgi:hypothetical protein